ncbi:MAG: PGF-pre-PGF domain-containing protein [Euryarchaeota archaeon]|nr:PGF-pre-PGF domain-containing protein [Euryarchaeota archaeon]
MRVSITADKTSVQKGGSISFNVSVELTSPDQYIPIQKLSLNLTGTKNVTWYFHPNGTLISGSGITITPAGSLGPYGYGEGYGYAYDDGNYYNFSYGYGYGDNNTYVMNYTITIDTSQLDAGSYTAAAYVYTGKSIKPYFSSPKVSFSVSAPPPPPSGGGGTGTVTIPPGTFKVYVGIIKPGEVESFNISADGAIYFAGLKIKALDWIAGARIKGKTVTKPADLPSVPAKHVLAYVFVDSGIRENAVDYVDITFRVPKRWLRERDASPEQVRLYRYAGGWQELPTDVSGEDAVYVYYTARSPGFSYFAIAAVEEAVTAPKPVAEEKPEVVLPPYAPEEEVKPPSEEAAPPEEEVSPEAEVPAEKPELELPKPVVRWVVVLIALVVILAAVAVVADYYYYRKRRR